MRIKTLYIFLILIIGIHQLSAQNTSSYADIENRFTKTELTKTDSIAFKKAGFQKAKSLFEYGDVYINNSSNVSNQAYVIKRVPDLFYVSEGDTLNTDSVMFLVNTMITNEKPNSIDLTLVDKEGTLGHVFTSTKNLNFKADIIIVKSPKNFGDSEEIIWQVFLTNPLFW
jgi:hypothetical protein